MRVTDSIGRNRSAAISHRTSIGQSIAEIATQGGTMKRATLAMSLVLVAAGALVTLATAQPRGPVGATAAPKKQKVLIGFYKNRTVKYFDYGRIRLRPGNKLAPMWVFTNGVEGQRSIVDSAPGAKKY